LVTLPGVAAIAGLWMVVELTAFVRRRTA
jgi:hypothetical protein